jgi:hypothetical protein
MITVFALYVYLGEALQRPITYWYDVNRCRYFARRLMAQPPVPGDPKQKIIAVCRIAEVADNVMVFE